MGLPRQRQRVRLDSELTYQQVVQKSLARLDPAPGAIDASAVERAITEARRLIDSTRHRLRELGATVTELESEIDRAFNPFFGPLFRVGVENSRFGEQVVDYACVYTSRASNFLAYSPLRYFRSPRDHMPHEL